MNKIDLARTNFNYSGKSGPT